MFPGSGIRVITKGGGGIGVLKQTGGNISGFKV